MAFLVLLPFWPIAGQVGESAGRVPPADGAVPGAALPRPKDSLPAEAAAGRSGDHQSPDIASVHGIYICTSLPVCVLAAGLCWWQNQ